MFFINYHGEESVHPDIGKHINEIENKEEITYQKNVEIEPTDGKGLISLNNNYLQYCSSKFLYNSSFGIIIGFILLFFISVCYVLLLAIYNKYLNNSSMLYDFIIFFISFCFIFLGCILFLYFKFKNHIKSYICNLIVFDREKQKVFIKSFDKTEIEIRFRDLKIFIVKIPKHDFYEVRFYVLDKHKIITNIFALACVSEKKDDEDSSYLVVLKAQWEFIRQYMNDTDINDLSKYIKSNIYFNKNYFMENMRATLDRYIGVPIIYKANENQQSKFEYVRSYNEEYAYWVSVVPRAINNHILGFFEFFGRFFVYFINKKPHWEIDNQYNKFSYEGIENINRKKEITKRPKKSYMLKFILWGIVSCYVNIFIELWMFEALFNAKVDDRIFDFTSYLKF